MPLAKERDQALRFHLFLADDHLAHFLTDMLP
jgi:hypothetical protein